MGRRADTPRWHKAGVQRKSKGKKSGGGGGGREGVEEKERGGRRSASKPWGGEMRRLRRTTSEIQTGRGADRSTAETEDVVALLLLAVVFSGVE